MFLSIKAATNRSSAALNCLKVIDSRPGKYKVNKILYTYDLSSTAQNIGKLLMMIVIYIDLFL